MSVDQSALFRRMDEADALISRVHPELGDALRQYRAKMRFRVFLLTNMRHGMTTSELAGATGLSEEQVKDAVGIAPKNPLDALSASEHQWLLDYYNSGQRLQVKNSTAV
ncbi:MAG: hypothetical protein A2942_05025 [Candidatus Lloydbacteria bacterium RIFCSPLOWO2_01_FULL_50_20]|uniref:Uncharacterized protein n=1 Tax=Candidatus Lloydbacteria bacterium RIFCSPLOWO2_01_FULL_50_20 TaxID=1798665 RepID=A0A1G2DBZ8_9BACT|nr:MAG: hypothetical protein A3C13_02525 [Candidatus Lloydbacteria bacterium RIFCSPHIGHO2_02_FULL_50_11]OGZ11134.1 MAG: hypothetical protein A2942_05025 [Candidatus Lloydbacteria bacterium RIFCSPLOWO2_01_FULL_50_20]